MVALRGRARGPLSFGGWLLLALLVFSACALPTIVRAQREEYEAEEDDEQPSDPKEPFFANDEPDEDPPAEQPEQRSMAKPVDVMPQRNLPEPQEVATALKPTLPGEGATQPKVPEGGADFSERPQPRTLPVHAQPKELLPSEPARQPEPEDTTRFEPEEEEETEEMKIELAKALGISLEKLETLTEEEKIYMIKRKIADRYIEKDPLGQDPIHIVYASAGAPPEIIIRSAWSAYATASDEAKKRIHVHVLYEDTPTMEEAFTPFKEHCESNGDCKVSLYEAPFGELPVTPKVWGYTGRENFLKKLETPANYWRFYIPEFLFEQCEAKRLLYLDADTVILSDIGAIWDKVFASTNLPVSSGTQSPKACTYGKQIKVTDERLRSQHLDPAEPCLQGGVLFIDVKKWVQLGFQVKAEQLLVTNVQRKLYSLGSMPPLLILLYDQYQKLPRKIVFDAKSKGCCEQYGKDSVGVVHPVKTMKGVADWQRDEGVFQPPWKESLINPEIDGNTGGIRKVKKEAPQTYGTPDV